MFNRRAALILLTALAGVAAAPAARAAEPATAPVTPAGAPRAITLAQALDTATRHNRTLLSARQQRMAAQAGLAATEATRLPMLSADANAQNPNGTSVTATTGALTLSYDLDTHGARAAKLRIGEAQRRLADIGLGQTSQAVRFEVMSAYYDLQSAEEQVRIAALNLKNATTSVGDAETQLRAGDATAFDVQRAKVQLGSAEQQLADAQGELTVARRRLVRVLGLPPSVALAPAGRVEAVAAWPLSREDSLRQALARRPELAMRALERESALEQSRLAWSNRGVQTNVFASGDAGAMAPGLGGGGFSNWPPGTNYAVGARMSWLLVDWGANQQGARQADIAAQVATLQGEDAALQIQLDVEQAFAYMTAAKANIRSAELTLAVAHQGLESARLRFKGGVGTQTDVLLAQADLVQAEGNRVRAILAFNKAVAQLEQVSGAVALPEPGT